MVTLCRYSLFAALALEPLMPGKAANIANGAARAKMPAEIFVSSFFFVINHPFG